MMTWTKYSTAIPIIATPKKLFNYPSVSSGLSNFLKYETVKIQKYFLQKAKSAQLSDYEKIGGLTKKVVLNYSIKTHRHPIETVGHLPLSRLLCTTALRRAVHPPYLSPLPPAAQLYALHRRIRREARRQRRPLQPLLRLRLPLYPEAVLC